MKRPGHTAIRPSGAGSLRTVSPSLWCGSRWSSAQFSLLASKTGVILVRKMNWVKQRRLRILLRNRKVQNITVHSSADQHPDLLALRASFDRAASRRSRISFGSLLWACSIAVNRQLQRLEATNV